MIGKTISHYKITDKLGEGGMGEVYLAEDTELDRKVALKFLPEHLTRDKENVERFRREAKAAAALNHPNIVTIFEISKSEEQIFIVMEYVDGVSLRTKIDDKNLAIEEILNITKQICDGLSEAHKADIVHRDIKPENILIDNRGRVKILDFGLAKLKGVSKLTKETSTLGTIHYMSPEQLQGKEVNHRSDIWSLGVVLYEMLIGEAPFKGDYESAVHYAILNEEPENLEDNISNELMIVVNKCLQKNPTNRYQSTEELLQVIKTFTISSKQPDRKEKSIIVLPFDDLSPDKDNEYFSDGLTEEIITDLSHIHDLLVISRNSAMTFKGTNKKTKEIAKEVNVQYVLEGSVRKAGNNLRIAAQLIDASTDVHLWAEKYNGTLDDVFDIQEKVSMSIVDALKIKLSPQEDKQITERAIEDIQAYEYYFKANAECWKMTKDSINHALKYLNTALELIGDNAYLYSGLAWSYFWLVNIGVKHEDFLGVAEENVQKALALDPDLSKAYAISGFIKSLSKGNKQNAVDDFKMAILKNPDDPMALMGIVMIYTTMIGKIPEAIPFLEKLEKIDPLDFMVFALKGCIHFYGGVFDKALIEWRKLYEIYPEVPYSWLYYTLGLAYNNKVDEALSFIDSRAATSSDNVLSRILFMLNYAFQGETEKIYQTMTPDLISTCKRDATYGHHLACIFALVNEREEALNWLENAVEVGFIIYPLLSEKDSFLENIRGEERFKKLMERVKYEWENFEV